MALRFVLSLFFSRGIGGLMGMVGGGCRGSMNLEGRGGGMLFKNGRMWRGTGGGAGWGGGIGVAPGWSGRGCLTQGGVPPNRGQRAIWKSDRSTPPRLFARRCPCGLASFFFFFFTSYDTLIPHASWYQLHNRNGVPLMSAEFFRPLCRKLKY